MNESVSPAVQRFRAALEVAASRGDHTGGGLLLPVEVARACRSALEVPGVALSLRGGGLEVPLGASDPITARAEQLQFTFGQGPAVEALRVPQIIAATPEVLSTRWSLFQRELFADTPYRSVMTVPMRGPADATIVLDLYFNDPDHLGRPGMADIAWTGEDVIRVLSSEPELLSVAEPEDESPAWLALPAARARLNVWVGTGMLVSRYSLQPADALELLRASAFARAITLDELAGQLVTRQIDLNELRP